MKKRVRNTRRRDVRSHYLRRRQFEADYERDLVEAVSLAIEDLNAIDQLSSQVRSSLSAWESLSPESLQAVVDRISTLMDTVRYLDDSISKVVFALRGMYPGVY